MNALVIEAMRNRVSAVTGRFVSTSCTPAPFTYTSRPPCTMPHTIPGMSSVQAIGLHRPVHVREHRCVLGADWHRERTTHDRQDESRGCGWMHDERVVRGCTRGPRARELPSEYRHRCHSAAILASGSAGWREIRRRSAPGADRGRQKRPSSRRAVSTNETTYKNTDAADDYRRQE